MSFVTVHQSYEARPGHATGILRRRADCLLYRNVRAVLTVVDGKGIPGSVNIGCGETGVIVIILVGPLYERRLRTAGKTEAACNVVDD